MLIALIVTLAVGIVLFIFVKSPKLTPKKVIVEAILEVYDALFPYRQEIRSLISDSFGLYQQHDTAAFTTRHSTASHRRQDMERQLANIESKLAPYEKVRAQKRFYDLASGTIGTLRQGVYSLDELQNEATMLEPIVAELQRIGTLTTDANMTAYVADDDNVVAGRVAEHITTITELLKRTAGAIAVPAFQTNEFQRIAQSIEAALHQAEQDYADLHQLLVSERHEAYRSKNQSLPYFLTRFDMSGYESIAVTTFSHNPEESLINDLRAHLYS